ncbi:hypothetical protein ACFZDK_24775 [Streptomyces sp. NPDC007901]|uniref:hypothetical protein n=1 Tax=Streptomyces sp. NPDC007901 TaxID=3364785 RepID=UPI0036EC447E
MKAILFGAALGALAQWPAALSLATSMVSALAPAAVLAVAAGVLARSAVQRIRRWAR